MGSPEPGLKFNTTLVSRFGVPHTDGTAEHANAEASVRLKQRLDVRLIRFLRRHFGNSNLTGNDTNGGAQLSEITIFRPAAALARPCKAVMEEIEKSKRIRCPLARKTEGGWVGAAFRGVLSKVPRGSLGVRPLGTGCLLDSYTSERSKKFHNL